MQPSIYAECMDAARRLLDGTEQPSEYGVPGIFTRLDVIFAAARRAGGWQEAQMKIAQTEASNALGNLFRNKRGVVIVRYGPVQIPGVEEPDYLRVDSEVIYAHPNGPESITTPNGTFPQIIPTDDPVTRQGRRLGTNRSDLKPWAEQDITGDADRVETSDRREIIRLREELRCAHKKLHDLEKELGLLRNGGTVTRPEVEELVNAKTRDLANRVSSLEGQLA